ncbi:hypothetical protein [Microbacterium binotii]|uniref:hypothetical protein n=1 Tax=Microbacterium binotii TaxID=462710 RepID=UPI001F2F7900|nr:hypothetical protein [Microbacterium binotii]UIN31888.1 hypothetical protein LXM64_06795 [Microbacterium binotii]
MNITDLERLLGRSVVAARLATPADPTSEILALGNDYYYLWLDEDGTIRTTTEASPITPTRIVIDADSFLAGAVEREYPPQADSPETRSGWIIGITTDGRPIQVPTLAS